MPTTPGTGSDGIVPRARRAPDATCVAGVVAGSDGAPLASATVTLTDQRGRQYDHCWTDETGTYQLTAPQPGDYLVICAYGAYQPHAAVVRMAGGCVEHDATLTGYGAVGGVVTSAAGTEVAAATVTVIDTSGDVVAGAETDGAGAYEVRRLAPGDYTVAVAADGRRPDATTVSVPLGGRIRRDVALTGHVRLSGTVRAASTGVPVHEALVTLTDTEGAVVATWITGPDGRYDFDELGAGEYTLSAAGYAPVAARMSTTAGEAVVHDVCLGPADI